MTASLHIYLNMIQVFFPVVFWEILPHKYCVTIRVTHFLMSPAAGKPGRLQGPDSQFCHHTEASGWRKAAHGLQLSQCSCSMAADPAPENTVSAGQE